MSDQTELIDGRQACADLTKRDSSSVTVSALEHRRLSEFQSWVVGAFASPYLCPKDYPQALTHLRTALVNG